jgi:hypothetical protein
MSEPVKIAIILSTRSDPNLLKQLLIKLKADPAVRLILVPFLEKKDIPSWLDEFEIVSYSTPMPRQSWLSRSLVSGAFGRVLRLFADVPKTISEAELIAASPGKVLYAALDDTIRAERKRLGDASHAFLQHYAPDVMVSIDAAVPPSGDLIYSAQRRGIPTLCIQHGYFFLRQEVERKWREFFPFDRVAVWGEFAKRLLVEAGQPEKKIAVTGSLSFDELAEVKDPDYGARIRRRLAIPPQARVVLLIMESFHRSLHLKGILYDTVEDIQAWYDILCQALREHPDLTVLVKPHPLLYPRSKDCLTARAHFDRLPNPVVWMNPTDDIWHAIAAADLAVTLSSSSCLQALAADKPVAIFSPLPTILWYGEGILEAAYLTENAAELSRLLTCLSQGEPWPPRDASHFLDEHAGPQDSGAADRLHRTIMELARR